MKMLIVEDDEKKRNQLEKFILLMFPECTVSIAKSYNSAVKAIVNNKYDIILLDMTMVTFDIGKDEDGGRPQAYAGREVLRQMDRRNIKTPVVVITQFNNFGEGKDSLTLDELNASLKRNHTDNYIGAIYYSNINDNWKTQLIETIKIILEIE